MKRVTIHDLQCPRCRAFEPFDYQTLRNSPIITSLLQTDWYKFLMMFVQWMHWRDLQVTFTFIQRSGTPLGTLIDIHELREQFEHVRRLYFKEEEILYVSTELKKVLLSRYHVYLEAFCQFLSSLSLPPIIVESRQGNVHIETTGDWPLVTLWEIPMMQIPTYLGACAELNRNDADAWQRAFRNGDMRLNYKIDCVEKNPRFKFVSFGTRRAVHPQWHLHVDERLVSQIPTQMLGTSSVYNSMKCNTTPKGTVAHEMDMVLQGLFHATGQSGTPVLDAHRLLKKTWIDTFGGDGTVFLPDTYGSDFFLQYLIKEEAECCRGFRIDSGNPSIIAIKILRRLEELDVDAKKKNLFFSDSLTMQSAMDLRNEFCGFCIPLAGIGTHLTFDLGVVKPYSIVAKVTNVGGTSVGKLSDTNGKATGTSEIVEWLKSQVSYRRGADIAIPY